MKAFEHAQERKLELSAELTDLLSRRLRFVTREFRYGKAPREIFARILRRKGEVARILRLMHEVDFLGRYLPEFGQLTCLVQHEYFHRYTADEHTLVCIEKLDALLETKSPKLRPYQKLFEAHGRIRLFFISRSSCTTPAKGSARGRIRKRARSSRKASRRVCSSRPSSGGRSSCWSIITSRSRTWRSSETSMTRRR